MMPTLNYTELLRLGWTRPLIAALLGKPDQVGPWRPNRWPAHLYARERVEAAMAGQEFRDAVARRQARAEIRRAAPERRAAGFTRKYGSWRGGLPAACRAMFHLNRFAKLRRCDCREEIYGLKDRLIEVLYREGLCTAAWVHVQTLPAKPCWECGGDGDNGFCWKCGGSGEYLPAKQVRFMCFRFAVAGDTYVWHRPFPVSFAVQTTEPERPWAAVREESVVVLIASRCAAYKHLVRWVVDSAALERAAVEWLAPRGANGTCLSA